ncbi:hypothetical protein [Subtercola frigoramans]|uniref:Uncharacterized protein n=1 Tax=Subtercola frigoramans TaxID=120298 RepID=A0ABS2L5G0_9MICO|nr:hypothetical protein [Subtercola frigoramans]MBM7471706.1 hypothetical protein [Subtercola frigoramans]
MRGAQAFGITANTTAADIINLDDLEAHTIWREIRQKISVLESVATVRINLSGLLND